MTSRYSKNISSREKIKVYAFPSIWNKKKKIALTERQNNRHEKQDGTGEPRVARTFLDTHNVTRRSPRHPNTRTVSRGRSRGSECFSLDFEFRNALPLSLPRTFSLSRARSLQFDPRVARLARSSRMLRAVQRSACSMATRSTISHAIHGWRHSLEKQKSIEKWTRVALTTGMLFYRSLLFEPFMNEMEVRSKHKCDLVLEVSKFKS